MSEHDMGKQSVRCAGASAAVEWFLGFLRRIKCISLSGRHQLGSLSLISHVPKGDLVLSHCANCCPYLLCLLQTGACSSSDPQFRPPTLISYLMIFYFLKI